MNSYWIEHQARQRIDDFAADARGDQLIRESLAPESSRHILGRRRSLRLRTWIGSLVVRSRDQAARAR